MSCEISLDKFLINLLYAQQRDRKMGKRWGQRGAPMKIRDASVTVRPTWVTIEDMDFPRLAKLSLPGIKEGIYIELL